MTKKQMIDEILESIDDIEVTIVRVYGLSMGVGYDYNIYLCVGDEEFRLKAHACSKAWDLHGHLRPNQIGYIDYKGTNEPLKYVDGVERYIKGYAKKSTGLSDYLMRYKKDELKEFYNKIKAIRN